MTLREARKLAGLTQEVLARIVGVSKGYICQLESGLKRNPSASVLMGISHALGVAPNAILPFERIQIKKPEDGNMETIKIMQLEDIVGDYELLDFNNGTDTIPADEMPETGIKTWIGALGIRPDNTATIWSRASTGKIAGQDVPMVAAEPDYYVGNHFVILHEDLLILSTDEGTYRFYRVS